jgi:hypothetical protein
MSAEETLEKIRILGKYAALIPNNHMSKDNFIMYADILSDYSHEELEAGLRVIVRTDTFYPSIARIREAIEGLRDTANDTHVADENEAWGELMREMRAKACTDKPPVFTRPEIAETVRNLDWNTISRCEESDLPTVRAHFRMAYQATCKRMKEQSTNKEVIKTIDISSLLDRAKIKKIDGGF